MGTRNQKQAQIPHFFWGVKGECLIFDLVFSLFIFRVMPHVVAPKQSLLAPPYTVQEQKEAAKERGRKERQEKETRKKERKNCSYA